MPTPGSPLLDGDDVALASERRHPSDQIGYQSAATVGTYSVDQDLQIKRISPIRICTYPEIFLDEAIEDYIPPDFSEKDKAYDIRKTRALSRFESFYGHYVDVTVGTALRKGVITAPEPGGEWEAFFDDVNLEGDNITSFVKTLFTSALDGGVAGIMVDYPRVTGAMENSAKLRKGLRPYLTIINVYDILDCRASIDQVVVGDSVSYEMKVKYLRIKSERRVASQENEHFELVVPTVVVYDFIEADQADEYDIPLDHKKVRVRVYQKNPDKDGEEYILIPTKENIFNLTVPYIAFTPVYGGKKEGYCRARPLHLDIARLNLMHWATACDLHETIHYNASPLLTATGVRADEDVFGGAARALFSENPNAKFGQISPGMEGAEVVLKELARLKASMDMLAAIAMAPGKTLAESGFAKLLDRAQSDSQLAILLESLGDALNKAIRYVSGFDSKSYPETKVSISKDFIPAKLHSQQIHAIVNLFKEAQIIDIKTTLEMLEAGEMFEGIHDFSVKNLLSSLGLKGTERYSDIIPREDAGPDSGSSRSPRNLMEESPDGISLGREVDEASGENPEASV